MRDFAAHVRSHLPPAGLPEERYVEIVDELASELEARYIGLVQCGTSDSEAWQEVLSQIPSWQALARELSAATGHPSGSRRRDGSQGLLRIRGLAPDRWYRDVRYGLRVLWKDRGFALTALATLAVCFGGHAVIVAGVNGILLHPLRTPEPERVLLMANQYPRVEATRGTTSATPDYEDRRAAVSVFEEQAFYNYRGASIEKGGVPTAAYGIVATPSLFRLLRVTAAYGRIFTDSEAVVGNDDSVVLSDGLWRELYGRDVSVIGRTIRLTDRQFTIVGILPPDFSFGGSDVRFWTPLALTDRQRADNARHSNGWYSIGRLKPSATIDQVRAQLKALDALNFERMPAQLKPLLTNVGFYTGVEPLQDVMVRDVRVPLLLLWGAAIAVLVIGVANLANLALVRSRLRVGEIGTRLAVGAGRFDLVRQLLVEALLISLAGATVGLGLGAWALSALRTSGLSAVRDLSQVHLDASVIGITLGLATLVGVIVGLTSALPLFMPLEAMLKEELRGRTRGRAARTSRRMLVVAQMACSFMLLVGAGLLWASVRNLLTVDPGFRTDNVLTGLVGLPRERYTKDDDARAFVNRSLDVIRRLPLVSAVGATTIVPLRGNYQAGLVVAEGYVPKAGEPATSAIRAVVTPGYFEAVGTPLVRGRYYDARDTNPETRSIVIDERLARRFWPDSDPVGRRIFLPDNPQQAVPDENSRWMTVIGVVRSAQLRGPGTPDSSNGTVYRPFTVTVARDFGFVISTTADPSAIVHELRTLLAGLDREVPLFDVRTLSERSELSLMLRTSTMQLATLFAVVALLLSALGLYGMLAYLVTQRRREIGVRLAIGSTPNAIVGLVLREGLALAGAGVVLGALGFLAIRRVLASQLYGIEPSDPGVMILMTLALAAVAVIACAYPARRASQVDVVQTLSAR